MKGGLMRRSLLLPLVLLLAGCPLGRRHDAPAPIPDLDVAARRNALGCATVAAGTDHAVACKLLDEFASAGPVTAWPAPGGPAALWLGRGACVTDAAVPEPAKTARARWAILPAPATLTEWQKPPPPEMVLPFSHHVEGGLRECPMPGAPCPRTDATIDALAKGGPPPADSGVRPEEIEPTALNLQHMQSMAKTQGVSIAVEKSWLAAYARAADRKLLLIPPEPAGCYYEFYRLR
jgi:hypothetical protein